MLGLVGQLFFKDFLFGYIASGAGNPHHLVVAIKQWLGIKTDITLLTVFIQVYGFILH